MRDSTITSPRSIFRHILLSAGVLAVALSFGSPALAAPQWQQLGPTGGWITGIATGPAGSGKVYVASATGLTATSDDEGLSWTTRTVMAGGSLLVRGDGQVFLQGSPDIWRSPDGMRSWEAYGPSADWRQLHALFYMRELVLDPRQPTWAVLAYASEQGWAVALKSGDTDGWRSSNTGSGYSPGLVAFDPLPPGQMIGVGMVATQTCPSTGCYVTATLKSYKSQNSGVTWQEFGVILPTVTETVNTWTCNELSLAVDSGGRYFLNTWCGILRSLDSGTTWQWLTQYPGSVGTRSKLRIDPLTPGRLVASEEPQDATSGLAGLYESYDAGDSWRQLPTAPPFNDFAIGARGELWLAGRDGAYRYDADSRSWRSRNTGLNGFATDHVMPSFGRSLVLYSQAGSYAVIQSLNDGLSWGPASIPVGQLSGLSANATLPGFLMATLPGWASTDLQQGSQLYVSRDAGSSWTLVNSSAQTTAGYKITTATPVGPQPGLVYGVESYRRVGVDGVYWAPNGIVKSLDGGVTWSASSNGLSGEVDRITVSPADSDTALAFSSTGGYNIFYTRDGAKTWIPVLNVWNSSLVVPDPLAPNRWYRFAGWADPVTRTDDYGVNWSPIADPPLGGSWQNLLVDLQDGNKVYAIGSNGAVALSIDYGASWRLIVQPSTLVIAGQSARWGASNSVIYAAGTQGVLKLDLAAAAIQPRDGLWVINAENNGQAGRGFQVETRNGTLVFTYYGYNADGHDHWYLATSTLAGGSFSGDMTQYKGGAALGAPYSPATNNGSAGTVTLSFSGPTAGSITLPGETAKAVSKFAFSGGGNPAIAPANGLWVIDAENNGQPGRGFQIEQNAGVLVFTYYGYNGSGQETWYLASGAMSGNSFTSALTEYGGGTVLGNTFVAATSTGSPGSVTINFTSATTGTITLSGEATKTISKFSW